ncbi:MAG: hypothetical protein QM736_13575 [Vicinamibacterales bacterium]
MLILGKVAAESGRCEGEGPRGDRFGRGARAGARQIVEGQGGDPRVVDDYGRLPTAPSRSVVKAERAG